MEILDTLELDGGFALGSLFITLVALAGNWRLFVKCGQPGWAVVVPAGICIRSVEACCRAARSGHDQFWTYLGV